MRILLLIFLIFPSWMLGQNSFTGKTPYVTQMHIHGWSNHNGAQKPGSLQYHNWQSDSVGIDVLWWAEHNGLFEQDTLQMPFTGATINPLTLDIENIPSGGGTSEINQWSCISKDAGSIAYFGSDTLYLAHTAAPGSLTPDTFSYSPRSLSGLVKDIAFSKPMVSKPVLQFQMSTASTDTQKTGLKIVIRLSWHYRQQTGQDIITYQFVTSSASSVIATNNIDSVTVTVPITNNWQLIALDLWEAAAVLDHGGDNTLSDIELQLLSKQGATVGVAVRDFMLVPVHYQTDSIIFGEKAFLDEYSATHSTHNILGVEYSGFQHLNAYFPKSENNHQIFEGKIYGSVNNWVNKVHLKGGLVSFNHMFGTDWSLDSDSVQDYRSDTAAVHLLGNIAYGSDILEVGYFKRGGSDLARHLKTWDKLTANGLFLYGNGVSDSHGDEWMYTDNLFHTYIWSADSSDYELLAALSLGKMFFGNQKLFKGEFYYTLGNLDMGDRGFINQNNVQPDIHLSPFPAGCKIRLTQILLNATTQPLTYLHNATLIDTNAIPILDMTQPSFIRIGVYDASDNPLVFGQPIVILGLQTGIDDVVVNDEPQVKIFPNPATEKLNLE
ncbi:MAG: hypothetical protein M3Q95_10560, partial [Bacteroidota bacterium]|nr:hypothetical protein [Bacteroidota bacterium]